MDDDNHIQKHNGDEEDIYAEFEFVNRPNPKDIFWAKVKIWSIVIGSLVVGTVLFLFLFSLFIYFFIPLLIIFGIVSLFNYLRRR